MRALALLARLFVLACWISWRFVSVVDVDVDGVGLGSIAPSPSLMRTRLTLDVVFFTVLVLLSFPPPSMEGLAWLLRYLMPTPPMFFARYPFPSLVFPLYFFFLDFPPFLCLFLDLFG